MNLVNTSLTWLLTTVSIISALIGFLPWGLLGLSILFGLSLVNVVETESFAGIVVTICASGAILNVIVFNILVFGDVLGEGSLVERWLLVVCSGWIVCTELLQLGACIKGVKGGPDAIADYDGEIMLRFGVRFVDADVDVLHGYTR